MNYEPLMEAIVQTVLFLELSGSETVDEDAAVGLMERLAALLQQLDPAEKQRFVEYTLRRAQGVATESTRERECMRAMPGNLGLTG